MEVPVDQVHEREGEDHYIYHNERNKLAYLN